LIRKDANVQDKEEGKSKIYLIRYDHALIHSHSFFLFLVDEMFFVNPVCIVCVPWETCFLCLKNS